MGSNMKTSFCLLLLPLVTHTSSSCDWFTTARSQPSFPVFARQPLYNLHQVDQLCKQSLHQLPLSSLPLVSTLLPENRDTVGAFLQMQGAKLEQYLMGNWAHNYSRDIVKFKWDAEKMTKKTLDVISWQASFAIRYLEDIKGSNNIESQYVFNAVSTFQTSKEQDLVTILDAFSCTLTRSNSSESDVDLKGIGKMMNTVGWQKTEDEKLASILEKLEITAINEAIHLLKACLKKITNFLLSFTEEMKEYETTLLQAQAGNSPQLENSIINILEKAKSYRFPFNLDSSFVEACTHRSKNTWEYLEETLKKLINLFEFLNKSISKNNKVDVLILVTELNNNLGRITEETLHIFSQGLDDIKRMLKEKRNAEWLVDRFLTIFYQAECKDSVFCQQEKLILAEKSEILVGGMFRAFVKHNRVNRFSSYGCEIDCSADCSDLKKEYGRCWSKDGCNKELLYDPECTIY